MNLRKRRAFHDEDAMAAMNDIMFFLMLFFLIISTLANPNVIRLMLPQSTNSDKISKQPLSLTVKNDLTYYLNTEVIPEDQLEAALKMLLSVMRTRLWYCEWKKNLRFKT